MTEHDNPNVRHETSDVNIRAILMFAAGLAAASIVIGIVVLALLSFFSFRSNQPATTPSELSRGQAERLPPEPRIQARPSEDLKRMRYDEDRDLTSYGWIDRQTGVVRIPIEQAKKLLLLRGLPARQVKP